MQLGWANGEDTLDVKEHLAFRLCSIMTFDKNTSGPDDSGRLLTVYDYPIKFWSTKVLN